MKRLTPLLAAALFVFAPLAAAHTPFSGILFSSRAVCNGNTSTYTGPGDVVSGAAAFWGVRAYNRAYADGCHNAFDLRLSGGATMTAKFIPSGDLDTATISAWQTANGGGSIFISKAYDQSGNGRDVVQVSTSLQPTLLLSGGRGNKPYVNATSSQKLAVSVTNFTPSTGVLSFSTVAYRSGNTTFYFGSANSNGGDWLGGSDSSLANTWTLRNGAFIGNRLNSSASDSTWHAGQGVINDASSSLKIDTNSATTGTVTTSTTAGLPTFCNSLGGTGSCSEFIFYDNLAIDSTQQSNLASNQLSYYN